MLAFRLFHHSASTPQILNIETETKRIRNGDVMLMVDLDAGIEVISIPASASVKLASISSVQWKSAIYIIFTSKEKRI